MAQAARVETGMPHDYGVGVSGSVELARINSTPVLSLQIYEDEDDTSHLYGRIDASVGAVEFGENDPGKHEHLLKSGHMGKCNDTFCLTCPSFLPQLQSSREEKHGFLGCGNEFRRSAASWCRTYFLGIVNPHTKIVQRWNKIFCISSLIAIFVDPVFFLLLSIRKENMCLVFNIADAVAVTIIRTMTDAIQVLQICLQFRLAYVGPASSIRFPDQLEDDPRKIAMHYLKGWFCVDLFTALPLPQLMIWTMVKRMLGTELGANYANYVLRVVVLIQNIPRTIRFFPLLIGRSPSGFVFETAWSNFVVNLLMYLLVGHIVGTCWYLFGLQRVNQCLEDVCKDEKNLSFLNGILFCDQSYLDCGDNFDLYQRDNDSNYAFWRNNTSIMKKCLTISSSSFEYGIYELGVPLTMEGNTVNKYIYSLFWGLQQISTLAGNQQPSAFPWEVIFTMSIVVLGIMLFALLIGNMQHFLQALDRKKLDRQLVMKRYSDTEEWMKLRRLPLDLRRRIRQAARYKWRLTGGLVEQDLIGDLQEDLHKEVQRYLCLAYVKEVRLFKFLEDHVLDSICERLYQRIYIDHSEILRAKKPVERMLFIVHGQLESFGDDGSVVILKEGDFCGEELLSWYLHVTGVSIPRKIASKRIWRCPLSSRTVKCKTSVETFCLDSIGLEYIVTNYKDAFRSPRVQGVIKYLSLYWRTIAADRIQKVWRSRRDRRHLAKRTLDSNSITIGHFASINDRTVVK